MIRLLFFLIFLSGCTATMKGKPERIVPDEVIVADIASVTSLESIKTCNDAKTNDCRNRIVYATILGIDMNFHNFENSLFINDRDLSFGSQLAELGLGAAAAYSGSTLYSVIATGITGSMATYNSKILQNQMLNTLQSQMSAQRNIVKARIYSNLDKSFIEYPLNLATIDLESYYNAGTLLSAMKQLSVTAANNSANATKALDIVNPTSAGNKE